MNYKFLNYIKNDKTYLEKEPLEIITKKKQLSAFKHNGFWQCMDTLRDKENIEKILQKKTSNEEKYFNCWWYRFYRFSHIQVVKKKNKVFSVSKKKPKKNDG